MYISLTLCLSEESYNLMTSLTKLRRESENSCGMVLASPSASQNRGLASDFKA